MTEQVPSQGRAFRSHSEEMLSNSLQNKGFPSFLSVMEKLIAKVPLTQTLIIKDNSLHPDWTIVDQ